MFAVVDTRALGNGAIVPSAEQFLEVAVLTGELAHRALALGRPSLHALSTTSSCGLLAASTISVTVPLRVCDVRELVPV